MIGRLLVANRGEIARRIIRTCRDLGVSPVAVCSDPDADAPHVREADAAVLLPGAAPADTYLRADLLVSAALASGADAVHPGYGFLAEHAGFARAVREAGLTWVGPDPDTIAALGSKTAAKRLMRDAGVPVLPDLDLASVTEFPVLVKADAGGGGRGLRIVRSAADLAAAVASAGREAASAFGDGTVFCEPLLENARHVEVQILADAFGTVWALGERECSIQRRHQKIVEETPSPAVSPESRSWLCAAAVSAARAVGYVGVGTVEFLLADDFRFLEVNTRLQVEHPVTELVYGLDLVAWQLAVAEGARLPEEPPAPRGHAVEARLCAEDPAHDWRPSSGTLHRFRIPGDVRVDSGVEDGSVVGVHYDPLLAKVVAWGPDRASAVRKLATALARADIHGLVTNRDLLVRTLRHPEFGRGATHTGFLAEHDLVTPPEVDPRPYALAAALAAAERGRVGRHAPTPPAWRNLPSQPQKAVFDRDGEIVAVEYGFGRTGVTTNVEVNVVCTAPDEVVLERDGVRTRFPVAFHGDRVEVGSVTLRVVPRFPLPTPDLAEGAATAPLPGTVVRVAVAPGQRVAAGAELLVLEAMKLEHRVLAGAAGTVVEVRVAAGHQVGAGDVLVVLAAGGART
ncbi:biotin carboxylase N-terminal domain-containing protein [Saccharothrix violaceirubra]|uniref:Propionyl-CoA carboxylase alpha chain n=1 Tax=Saccharothrix violaceirubra TaxID=413306 RepID=A0A7W7T5X5_9PSEU|nr:biotin carboxylase N-terminal domain-containing protein [Saccharothrix violaceirubra]MBB4967177.1 propionyl-CoA carboxylase alpha chain [Saccharothrix violaceirubra]